MMRRFCFGLGDALQRVQELLDGVHRDQLDAQVLRGRQPPPARARPGAAGRYRRRPPTSWSPTARWTRAVATLESTPPLTAASTRSPPTCAADALDARCDDRLGRPIRAAPRRSRRRNGAGSPARRGCGALRGGTARRNSAALQVAHGGDGAVAAAGQRDKAGRQALRCGRRATSTPAGCRAGRSGLGTQRLDLGRAVFALGGGGHPPAQGVGQGLHAVADAQDGQPALQHVGGDEGRSGLVDRGRPAGKDEAFGLQRQHLSRRAHPRGTARSRPAARAPAGRSAGRIASQNRGWRSSPMHRSLAFNRRR